MIGLFESVDKDGNGMLDEVQSTELDRTLES